MQESPMTLQEIRDRLQSLLEEYHEIESELERLEDTRFRVFICGSARIRPHDPLYQEIYCLARALAAHGMDIVTGGGPGAREVRCKQRSMKGYEAGARSGAVRARA